MSTDIGGIESFIRLRDDFTTKIDGVIARLDKLEATTTKTARKTVSETDKAKTAYNRLAASLDPVIARSQKYERSQETLNRALKLGVINQDQYNKALSQAKERLETTTHWTQRLGNEIGSGLKAQITSLINPTTLAIAGVTALAAGAVKLVKDIVAASIEAEKSASKVSSAVERYGARAGVTVADVDRLATAQSRLTGIDDELIADTIALGLKFNRLSGDEIPRLIRVAQDMAQVTGMDLSSAMQKAGGYVNLPLQALTKLRKEGYAVGESQEKLVKSLLRTGDIAGAQDQIFRILESQYGGAAVAARDTLGGALTALGTTWENFLEKVGEDRLGPLRQGVEKLIDLIEFLTDKVDTLTLGWITLNLIATKHDLALAKGRQAIANMVTTVGETEDVKRLRKEVEELDKAQAKLTLKMVLPPGATDYLDEFAKGHKKAAGAADEQTGSEDNLNDKLRQQAEAIAKVISKQQEELKYLNQKLAIASLPPGTDQQYIYEQLQKINDEHEYRIDLLSKIEQFGPRIGKQLADTDRELKKLAKSVDLKFKLQFIQPIGQIEKLRSGVIDLFGGVQQGIDQGMNQLLDHLRDLSLEQGKDILAGRSSDSVTQANNEMWADLQRQHEEFWQDYSAEVRGGWDTSIDIIKREMEKVEAAYKSGVEGALTAAEMERELARLRIQLMQEEIDHILTVASGWQTFFSQIGGMFGGFAQTVSNTISQMISTAQAFQSAGSQIGGQIGGIISSAGPFFAIAGAAISLQQQSIARSRQRQYTSSVNLGFSEDVETAGRQGTALANALQSALDPILSLIDRTLENLPQIEILARQDSQGFLVSVGNLLVGTFATLEDAVDAATVAALEQIASSLSESVRTAIQSAGAQTSEELQAAIEFAVNYENLGLSDMAVRVKEIYSQLRKDLATASKLGLGDGKILDQFNNDLQRITNELLGINTSTADILKNLVDVNRVLTEQTDAVRQQHEQRLRGLQEELAALGSGPRTLTGERGSIQETPEHWERTRQAIEDAIADITAEIDKLPQALTVDQLDMGIFDALFDRIKGNQQLSNKYAEEAIKYAKLKAEAEIEALRLQLIATGRWEEFAAMFEDVAGFIRTSAGEDVRRRGRGGSGGSDRDSVRDFISDRSIDLAMRRMTEYQRSVAETTRQYDDLIKQAGKDNALRAQLISLREQELELMAREAVESVTGKFREFLGLVSPFDQVRKTAADLIKEIEGSPLGDARKARMIGRVLADIDRQITQMSREMAVSLGGSLLNDLQKYGAEESLQTEIRHSMAMLEHMLALENYQVTIAKLKAEGKIAPEVIAGFERAYNFLAGLDWETVFNPPGSGGDGAGGSGPYTGPVFQGYEDVNTTISSVSDSLEEMTDLLQRYRDQGLSPYQLALRDLNRDFDRIRLTLGNTAEVTGEYQSALSRLREEYLGSMNEFYDTITTGPMSGLSVEQQYDSAIDNWNRLTAAISSTGDLSLGDDAVEAAQQAEELFAQLYGTSTGGYQQLLASFRATLEGLGVTGTGGGGSIGSTSPSSLFANLDTPSTIPSSLLRAMGTVFTSGGDEIGAGSGVQAQVDATEDVSTTVDVHGTRQERLLGDIKTVLTDLLREMRNGNGGGGNNGNRPNWNPSFSYGDE